jgi:uncharacterized protein YoxC
MARVEEYQRSQGLKTRSDAVIDLLEKGLSNSPEFLNYQTCPNRNEIPAYYLKFVDCIERGFQDKIKFKHRITQEQCMACALFKIIKLPWMTLEQIEEEIIDQKITLDDLEKKVENAETEFEKKTVEGLKEQMEDLIEDMKEKDARIETLEKEVLRNEKPIQGIREQSQKLEESRRITERVVEEKKTTEKFLPTQQPKMPSELVLCPKTTDYVSVDDACKKCDSCVTCSQYAEYFMLKRAIKNQ